MCYVFPYPDGNVRVSQRKRDGSKLFITSTINFATVWFIAASLDWKIIGRLAKTKVAAVLTTIYTIMFEYDPLRVFLALG